MALLGPNDHQIGNPTNELNQQRSDGECECTLRGMQDTKTCNCPASQGDIGSSAKGFLCHGTMLSFLGDGRLVLHRKLETFRKLGLALHAPQQILDLIHGAICAPLSWLG